MENGTKMVRLDIMSRCDKEKKGINGAFGHNVQNRESKENNLCLDMMSKR